MNQKKRESEERMSIKLNNMSQEFKQFKNEAK